MLHAHRVVGTAVGLSAMAWALFHRPPPGAGTGVEATHRVVCTAFQMAWLAGTVTLLLAWPGDGDDHRGLLQWLADALAGYFLYDAVVLLVYTPRDLWLYYVHHALSVAILAGVHIPSCAWAEVRACAWLVVCLELGNPLNNLQWVLEAKATGGDHHTMRRAAWLVYAASRAVWLPYLMLCCVPWWWLTVAMCPFWLGSVWWLWSAV